MKCFFLMNGNGNGNGEKKTSSKSSASASASTWTSMDPPDITKSAASSSEFNSSDMSTTTTAESSSTQRTSFAAGSLSTNHQQNLRVFTVSELKSATKNFSRSLIIGEGGFGSVYKGLIKTTAGADPQSKLTVAVKQLGKRGLQGHKEWVTEVNVLGVVDHPNLVKLVGYCADDDERGIQRLLIYEYMPNRSVEDHLSAKSFTPLPWSRRLKIAQDAARGLAYLHEEMEFQIIFRDFKTSNILLDDQWNAKLSDFGLARLGPSEGLSHVSTAVVGTMGYAAPEYMQTGRLTAKSDVWSYGVVLYELLTGRRPLDKNRPRGEQKLLEWIRPKLSDMKKFKTILDPRLEGEYSIKSVQKLAAVANRCLVRHPKARPKMSEVYEMVKQIVEATEVEKPQDHQKIISEEAEMDKSDLKRKTVCDHIPKSGWFVWRSWRPKLARTC